MSKKAEILRECISCHDKHMCQKIKEIEGSCISGVSVLQKVTLKQSAENNRTCKRFVHKKLKKVKLYR